MRFKSRVQGSGFSIQNKAKLALFCLLLTIFLSFSFYDKCQAVDLDRIVAIIDDDVILSSELEDAFLIAAMTDNGVTKDEVLEDMIERFLLLKQAKRFRISSLENGGEINEDDRIVNEYIEKTIRAVIYIPFEKMESYYMNNIESYGNRKFHKVKDEVEAELIEEELKNRLKKHINELRNRAYIRVQLKER
ncbi:MAG: hypothetical protein ABFR82_04445 [Nitrospirota bacterium]